MMLSGWSAIVLFTVVRLSICLGLYVLLRALQTVDRAWTQLWTTISCLRDGRAALPRLQRLKDNATTFTEWRKAAIELDR